MQTTMLLEEQPIWLVNIGEKTMKYDMKENNKIMLLSIKPWNLLLDFMVKKKKKSSIPKIEAEVNTARLFT